MPLRRSVLRWLLQLWGQRQPELLEHPEQPVCWGSGKVHDGGQLLRLLKPLHQRILHPAHHRLAGCGTTLIAVETALSSYGVGPPPAQIRTGSATASGSCLGFWRRSAHRAMGDTSARQESTGSASGASVSRSLRLAVLGVAMPGATAAQPDPGMSGAAFHCRGLRGRRSSLVPPDAATAPVREAADAGGATARL